MTPDNPNAFRLVKLDIDLASLAAVSRELEHERECAITDLLEENQFHPDGAQRGPFSLRLSLEDTRLAFDISGPEFTKRHLLSVTPLRQIIRDYLLIRESYFDAVRSATPMQIESIDMGRRGVHNEGARLLIERLEGKIALDQETARRLFTLIVALYRR